MRHSQFQERVELVKCSSTLSFWMKLKKPWLSRVDLIVQLDGIYLQLHHLLVRIGPLPPCYCSLVAKHKNLHSVILYFAEACHCYSKFADLLYYPRKMTRW